MKDRKINVTVIDATNSSEFSYQQTFESYRALLDFFRTEANFWQSKFEYINQGKPTESGINLHTNLNAIVSTLEAWQKDIDSWDTATLENNLQHFQSNYFDVLRQYWYWSGHSFIEPYIECVRKFNDSTAAAFLEYVLRKTTNHPNNQSYLTGYFLGYEFINQDSVISKRRNAERPALAALKRQYDDARIKLFGEVEDLKAQFVAWDIEAQAKSARLFSAQRYLGERKIRNQNNLFGNHMDEWQNKLTDLEHTYAEKLKLEKPAEYWSKAAKRYGRQAGLWMLAIIALVIVGIVYFREFFLTWLQGKSIGIELNSLQGAILFGSFAAAYSYLLRVLSRLTFSSFHLMRDAEEREQLTYLYLSLSNESVVDEKSRDIVLQALFSRTQTGLLLNESGPTMPGINEIATALSKGASK